MDEADGDDSTGDTGAPLPPFPEEYYDLPDEELAIHFWAWWLAAQAEGWGIQTDRITPEIAEIIRRKTPAMETDDENVAGIEKALHLIAGGDPSNLVRAGAMIRARHFRLKQHKELRREAETGQRRQSANASQPRPDGLQSLILELVQGKPAMTPTELLTQLRKHAGKGPVDTVDDVRRAIEWHDENHPAGDTPFAALKDRLSRARKKSAAAQKKPPSR